MNVVKTNDVMVARLSYREVASHNDYAYKNDGYRVMEELTERVPGESYKTSRTVSVDDAMGVRWPPHQDHVRPTRRSWLDASTRRERRGN
ncbi:hypothetical protein [Haladaptatus sp. DFWS20]|uniref:hypothetical protein n=1 Tax=Haladaptatus sp. DFWS20 TaxID=3403467 RepID=UPI003EBBFBB3